MIQSWEIFHTTKFTPTPQTLHRKATSCTIQQHNVYI